MAGAPSDEPSGEPALGDLRSDAAFERSPSWPLSPRLARIQRHLVELQGEGGGLQLRLEIIRALAG